MKTITKTMILSFVMGVQILGLMTACQRASKIGPDVTKDIVDNLSYIQDQKTGECFAVVASRHAMEVTQNGFTITWVPCSPKVLEAVKNEVH